MAFTNRGRSLGNSIHHNLLSDSRSKRTWEAMAKLLHQQHCETLSIVHIFQNRNYQRRSTNNPHLLRGVFLASNSVPVEWIQPTQVLSQSATHPRYHGGPLSFWQHCDHRHWHYEHEIAYLMCRPLLCFDHHRMLIQYRSVYRSI